MIAVLLLASLTPAELFRQGAALFDQGRFAEADRKFEQAVQLAPNDAKSWKALGASRAAQRDYERALAPFERACTLEPALEDACYFHARNLYALNRFEPALAILRPLVGKDRQPWRIHLAMAQASEGLGRTADAEASYVRAVDLYAKLPSAGRGRPDFDPRLHLAVFLFRQARLPEAQNFAEAVVRASPGYGRAHFELGRILHHQGQQDAAIAELEKAVATGAGAPAHLLLGRLYLRVGKTAEAQEHLRAGAGTAEGAPSPP